VLDTFYFLSSQWAKHVFVNSALKNTLLQTAFMAILPAMLCYFCRSQPKPLLKEYDDYSGSEEMATFGKPSFDVITDSDISSGDEVYEPEHKQNKRQVPRRGQPAQAWQRTVSVSPDIAEMSADVYSERPSSSRSIPTEQSFNETPVSFSDSQHGAIRSKRKAKNNDLSIDEIAEQLPKNLRENLSLMSATVKIHYIFYIVYFFILIIHISLCFLGNF